MAVGAIVGSIIPSAYSDTCRGQVSFVYIDRAFRFGVLPYRLLLDRFETWVKSLNCTLVDMSISATPAGFRLARRVGYTPYEAHCQKVLS